MRLSSDDPRYREEADEFDLYADMPPLERAPVINEARQRRRLWIRRRLVWLACVYIEELKRLQEISFVLKAYVEPGTK